MKTLIRISLAAGALALVACSGNGVSGSKTDMAMAQANPDMARQPGNPDLAPACSTNPMTHIEIINACTNADEVDKTPFYPTLAPNGQLPPLP